jgi:hypothetical protein
MNWYLSKLVFRIICGDGTHTAQFDEQLRIIRAEDELHAFQKARSIGERECMEEHIVRRVQWKFIDVSEIHELSDFIDGAEIYSKIIEEDDSDLYIRSTQKRAKQLLQDGLNNFTLINNIAIGC